MNTTLKICAAFSLVGVFTFGQTGINTDNPHSSSIFESKSEDKGLLVPRLTQTDFTNMSTVPEGLIVYNTTSNLFEAYNGTVWGPSPFYSQDFWKMKGNAQTVSNTTNILGTTDAKIFTIRTNNSKAFTIETNSQIRMGDRDLNTPRLNVGKVAANSTLPAIVIQHSTGFGDGVLYPNDIALTNTSTGIIKGTFAFADNITDAQNGVSKAGISYAETGGSDSGFSFYIGGHPSSSLDKSFEKMKVSSAGNVGIGITNPVSKLQIEDGDIFIADSTKGIILNSGNGCRRLTVNNSGVLETNAVACP